MGEQDAPKKAEDDAAKKNYDAQEKPKKDPEAKRQEAISNHLSKPHFMLAPAISEVMKDGSKVDKVRPVIHIKTLCYPKWTSSLKRYPISLF